MRNVILALLFSCSLLAVKAQQPVAAETPKVHKVVVVEVLQATEYTYLRVQEDTNKYWIAVPKMEAKYGETYYHIGGLYMREVKSRDLERTFPEVYFMEYVSKTPEGALKKETTIPDHSGKPKVDKAAIKVDPCAGCLTLSDLFKSPESYSGKLVRIKGQVVKYNEKIMGKNWVHLQDGTSFGSDFDLTATLKDTLTVGDVVTLEGKITLNKDFGAGYFFKVILEEAVLVK